MNIDDRLQGQYEPNDMFTALVNSKHEASSIQNRFGVLKKEVTPTRPHELPRESFQEYRARMERHCHAATGKKSY